MHANHPKNWSFREQLRVIIFIALFFIIGCGLFGAWRLQQFNASQVAIQLSSQALQQNLHSNFERSRLIDEIHTQLRLYMQSGSEETLRLIHKYSKELQHRLSKTEQKSLDQFLEMVDTLEVRMKSLDENTKKIFQIEEALINTTGQLMNISSREEGATIRPLVIGTCLQHHQLYVSSIVSSQTETLIAIQQEAAGIFTDLDTKLTTLGRTLNSDQQLFIEKLKTTNYELDATVHTITSIRITTLETQHRIEQFLETLNAEVTEDSLTRNSEASALMDTSLRLGPHQSAHHVRQSHCIRVHVCGHRLLPESTDDQAAGRFCGAAPEDDQAAGQPAWTTGGGRRESPPTLRDGQQPS